MPLPVLHWHHRGSDPAAACRSLPTVQTKPARSIWLRYPIYPCTFLQLRSKLPSPSYGHSTRSYSFYFCRKENAKPFNIGDRRFIRLPRTADQIRRENTRMRRFRTDDATFYRSSTTQAALRDCPSSRSCQFSWHRSLCIGVCLDLTGIALLFRLLKSHNTSRRLIRSRLNRYMPNTSRCCWET